MSCKPHRCVIVESKEVEDYLAVDSSSIEKTLLQSISFARQSVDSRGKRVELRAFTESFDLERSCTEILDRATTSHTFIAAILLLSLGARGTARSYTICISDPIMRAPPPIATKRTVDENRPGLRQA